MSASLSFPSTEFPAFPQFTVTVPDDWEALVVPNTVLAAGAPQEPEQFRPNVCVSIERFPGTHSIDEVANRMVDRFNAIEDFEEVGQETRTILDRPGFRIEGSFVVEKVGTVFQAVHTTVINHAASSDVIEAVATCSASQAREFVPILREVLDSLATEELPEHD